MDDEHAYIQADDGRERVNTIHSISRDVLFAAQVSLESGMFIRP